MKVTTADEMRNLDKIAIENYLIPGLILMENAGFQIANQIKRYFPDSRKVGLMVGKGNNGGDALVVARHLARDHREITLFLTSPGEMLKGDARINYLITSNLGLSMKDCTTHESFGKNKGELLNQDIIVDGLFGTGLKEGIKGHLADVVNYLNQIGKPIVSIDIPSGLSSDLGELIGPFVRANLTVSLGLPKLGQLLYPAAKYNGKLEIVDIGLPEQAIAQMKTAAYYLQKDDFRNCFPLRQEDAHKGSFGHVLIVAGSKGMLGAAILASLSSLRIGAGLTTLALPQSLNSAAKTAMMEVMTLPLEETPEGTLSPSALALIEDFFNRIDSVVVGPGLTTHADTAKLVKKIIIDRTVPMVLDADALNCLEGDLSLLSGGTTPLILTPHPGEMARLLGCPISDIQKNRIEIARNFAIKYGVYLILKGAKTVIATPKDELFINSTGNPGMATAGMGDVLAGMLGGLLAQGITPDKAATLAVFLHGLAGDLAATRMGQPSLIAGDLLHDIPKAITTLAQ